MRSNTSRPERLLTFAVALTGLVLAGCGGSSPGAPEPKPRDLAAWRDDLDRSLKALATDLDKVRGEPWFRDTKVVEEIGVMFSRLRARKLRLDKMIPEKPDLSEAERAAAEEGLRSVEAELEGFWKLYHGFRETAGADAAVVHKAYTYVQRANETLAYLLETGVPMHDHQANLRELSTRYEEGIRFWTEQMANALGGREEVDPVKVKIGIKTLEDVHRRILPIDEKIYPARVMSRRIRNVMLTIPGRLDWAAGIHRQVPEDDPWQKEADIARFRSEWESLRAESIALQKRVLEPGRETRKACNEQVERLNSFLQELNRAYIPKAREQGLPLPPG